MSVSAGRVDAFGVLAGALMLCIAACETSFSQGNGPEIKFAADGVVSRFDTGNGTNLVNAERPGKGFFIRTFNGTSAEDTRL